MQVAHKGRGMLSPGRQIIMTVWTWRVTIFPILIVSKARLPYLPFSQKVTKRNALLNWSIMMIRLTQYFSILGKQYLIITEKIRDLCPKNSINSS